MSGVSRGYAASRFGSVHYWSVGQGPVILLLHQSAQSSDEYLGLAPFLAESYRLLAIDLPGHGASEDPDHELSVDEFTAAVIDVLDGLQVEQCHVAGHHGGAYLALSLAAAQPRRIGKTVFSGLGLLPQETIDRLLIQPMSRDLPLDENGDFLSKTWAIYRQMSASGATAETCSKPFLVGLSARMRPYDMHYAILRWDAADIIASHTHPTLLLRGTDDIYSGDVAAVYATLSDSSYIQVSGGGAWLFYEQPEACARLIRDFLQAN